MLPPTPVLIIRTFVGSGGAGVFWSNVSYWTPVGTFTLSTIQTAANDAFALFQPLYSNCCNIDSTFQLAEAQYITGAVDINAASTTPPVSNNNAGDPVSDQNSVVLRKISGLPGRQNRGRYFVSSLSSSVFNPANPDEIATAQVANFQTLAAAYATDQTYGGIVCHARHWDRKDGVLVPIVGMRVSSRIASRDDRRRHAPNLPL